MAGSLKWDGDQVQARIRREITRRIGSCCKLVMARAKELLSVAGTGVREETEYEIGQRTRKANHKILLKDHRTYVKTFNEANKLGIRLGKIKRLRVTKSGKISNRRKPRKPKAE